MLALLNQETFNEVKRKSEDELSKFNSLLRIFNNCRLTAIENIFGGEAARLLFDEAKCEENF